MMTSYQNNYFDGEIVICNIQYNDYPPMPCKNNSVSIIDLLIVIYLVNKSTALSNNLLFLFLIRNHGFIIL